MEFMLVEYRDPLFGIIVLFLLITIISYLNYTIGKRKNSKEIESIKNFVKNFETTEDMEELKSLKKYNLSSKSLSMLAKLYEKNGNIQKAINIYLLLLEEKVLLDDRKEKHILLANIGSCYLKAGFLQKSKSFFKESLKIFPRNAEALNSLIILYEKLRQYEKALNIIEALEEIRQQRVCEKRYFQSKIILSDKNLSFEQKSNQIFEFAKQSPIILRLYLEFLIKNQKDINFKEIDNLELSNSFDILWSYVKENFVLKNSYQNHLLNTIFYVKGVSDKKIESNILELDIMAILKQNSFDKAMLSFEYICCECKNVFPIYFYRCPNCNSFASGEIEFLIIKKSQFNNSFF